MFSLKTLQYLAVASCFISSPLLLHATNVKAATQADSVRQTSTETIPPADAFRVLPHSDSEGPGITSFLLYQTALGWHQDGLRQARWSQVKNEADLQQLRAELRKSVLEMIGELPKEKTDLKATIVGRISANGFHIEKLVYQSVPHFYVTALVYVPDDGAEKHPAVLVPAGHSAKGKIYYQDLCQRLVHRGYLVIIWDPVGQGERSQFWDAKTKKSRYNLICAEHAVMGNLAYLAGTNLARWEIWDGMRAVDYLLTRSDVDPQRISITGTSGGGFQTALLGALDERIKVIIPSCYITALPMRIGNRIFVDPDSDPEQDLFGFISKGVDHAGLLLMMYPRPVMVATAALDFFPVQGAQKSYSEVHNFYERFGHGDQIKFVESYNQHQYSLANQEAALNFLDRFNKMPVRHGLAPVTEFSDAELRVTKSGQISVDYPDMQSVLQLIARYYSETAPRNSNTLAQLYRSEHDPDISSWTVGPYTGSTPSRELRWEAVGTTKVGALHIDRYVLHHSTYLEMPLLHFYNGEGPSKRTVLWFSLNGKATQKDWPEIAKLLNEGNDVFSIDFRGLGETRMNYRARSSDDPDLVQGTFDQAYANPLSGVLADYVYNSLLTGRPYFLQMMDDLKIATLFIRSQNPRPHLPQQTLTLVAPSEAYNVAVRFKEIDPRVNILTPEFAPTLDWSALVTQRKEQWPVVFIMPSGAFLNNPPRTHTLPPELTNLKSY